MAPPVLVGGGIVGTIMDAARSWRCRRPRSSAGRRSAGSATPAFDGSAWQDIEYPAPSRALAQPPFGSLDADPPPHQALHRIANIRHVQGGTGGSRGGLVIGRGVMKEFSASRAARLAASPARAPYARPLGLLEARRWLHAIPSWLFTAAHSRSRLIDRPGRPPRRRSCSAADGPESGQDVQPEPLAGGKARNSTCTCRTASVAATGRHRDVASCPSGLRSPD